MNSNCDGIIACYGSRIRDYLYLEPICPTLLLFAEEDFFSVNLIIEQLQNKVKVEIIKLNAHHGFLDKYSKYYDEENAKIFQRYGEEFCKRLLLK